MYNGWTNYETWCVNLWLGNENPSYRYWREETSGTWAFATPDPPFTRSEKARIDLANQLKEEVEEANPLGSDASVWTDLMGAAPSEVNWQEIANGLLEECEGYVDMNAKQEA